MLKRFEVIGYKNFKNRFIMDLSKIRDYKFNPEAIRYDIVNTAIIYGKNAVGKTNFGRAILDIRNNIFSSNVVHSNNLDFLNADSDLSSAEFVYEFQFDDVIVTYSYKKSDVTSLDYEELYIDAKLIFQYDHLNKKLLNNNLDKIKAQTLTFEFANDSISILSYIINNTSLSSDHPMKKMYNFIRGMRLIRGNLLSERLLGFDTIINSIIKNNLVDDFEKFLNHFGINEKLIVINTPTGDKMLCFDHSRPIAFIQNCSSGTASLVQLYSWYQNLTTASFLYLDEFDAFYHYELSKKIISLFKKISTCQTITTSHNTDLLTNKIMRPDCLFILTKEKITALADATNRELREGHNLEKLYKSGEFNE